MSKHADPNWYDDPPAEATHVIGQPAYVEPEPGGRDTLLFDVAPLEHDAPPPEGDRIWVHLLWEVALLLGVVGVVVAILSTRGAGVLEEPDRVRSVTILLLVTMAVAWSLRAGVPNLAVGPVAAGVPLASPWLIHQFDLPVSTLTWVAFPAALAVGLVLAALVVGFHVPGWAVSVGAAVVLLGLFEWLVRSDTGIDPAVDAIPELGVGELVVFGVVAGVSVVGGALWTIPRLRRAWGATRAEQDPARRPAPGGRVGALVALIGSTLLAAAAGVLLALGDLPDDQGAFATDPAGAAYEYAGVFTAFALAAALLGGVSAYGRRAGVFGTVLAVLLLALPLLVFFEDAESYQVLTMLGAAVLVGLVVNRGLETAGRQPTAPPLE